MSLPPGYPRITWSAPRGTTRVADDDRYKGRFTFQSRDSGKWYVIAYDTAIKAWTCDCKAGVNRGECKHLKMYGRYPTRAEVMKDRDKRDADQSVKDAAWAEAVVTGVLSPEDGNTMAQLMSMETAGKLNTEGKIELRALRDLIKKGKLMGGTFNADKLRKMIEELEVMPTQREVTDGAYEVLMTLTLDGTSFTAGDTIMVTDVGATDAGSVARRRLITDLIVGGYIRRSGDRAAPMSGITEWLPPNQNTVEQRSYQQTRDDERALARALQRERDRAKKAARAEVAELERQLAAAKAAAPAIQRRAPTPVRAVRRLRHEDEV